MTFWEKLFDITHKLIFNQKQEIQNVSTIEWQFTLWMRSSLLHDKVVKLSKAKVHVHSDSVLGLGRDARTSGDQGEVERSGSVFPGFQ